LAFRTTLQISELDELTQSWPGSAIHPVQTSSGPLDFVLDGVVSEGFSVLRMSLTPRLVDHVHIRPHSTGVVLVERPLVSMGVAIAAPALLINHSDREYHTVLEPDFRSVEFMLDIRKLSDHPLGLLLAEARAAQDQTIIPLNPTLAARIRATADSYVAAAELDSTDSLRACLVSERRCRILDLLQSVVEQHRGQALNHSVAPARGSLALASLREMERMGIDRVKVKDVCQKLGVSRRAVEKSFAGVLGISPAQYLLACRLNKLRQSLLGSTLRVADGLADTGFADASRAARQYRRLFGELPSSTLQRAQQRVTAG
jgi:AraC-like DNA-binding protein